MKRAFGYIRVSTPKQGEKGVSLQEQRDAIERYCGNNSLEIVRWFEERETAAKRGRPLFNEMLQALKAGKAEGVVIHKIDRSARNLRDWADLGELIDQGINVMFANESLDLQTRGGRLTADIQAVVAADYIRNLREETRKGFYGRLKQGIYPRPAPLGYCNPGAGLPKNLDPIRAPLLRLAFELYGSGRFNLDQLTEEMKRRGLKNFSDHGVKRSQWALILRNPFYIGMILIRTTKELFTGAHEPLISKTLFDRVQAVLDGRYHPKNFRHWFAFRRLLVCDFCQSTLIGERQKGHTYYRCHTSDCPTRCVREEGVDETLQREFFRLNLDPREEQMAREAADRLKADSEQHSADLEKSLQLRLSNIDERLTRLTDAYLDQVIDKPVFEHRKNSLLMGKKDLEQQHQDPAKFASSVDRLAGILELAKSAYVSYKMADAEEKRDLVQELTSNRRVAVKNVIVKLKEPFELIASREKILRGAPRRHTARTWDPLILRLSHLVSKEAGITTHENRDASTISITA